MLFVALEKRILSSGGRIFYIQSEIWSNDGINGNRPRLYRMRLSKSITQSDRDHRGHRRQFFIEHRRYVKIQLETVVKVYEAVARRHKNKRK